MWFYICAESFRYINGETNESTKEVLKGLVYYPHWVWHNTRIASFVDWLFDHNEKLKFIEPDKEKRIKVVATISAFLHAKVGFYGLDLYSVFGSIHAINDYLKKVDPKV